MDRNLHMKHVPVCPRNIGIVDQYSWAEKDTNKYACYNGISHPIYDTKGWINYGLPLEMYPPVDAVHPQIAMVKRGRMNYRGPVNPALPARQSPFAHGPVNEHGHTRREVIDDRMHGLY